MDLSFKSIPLVLTSSMLSSPPNNSGVVKKRKLSECSESSNSNSISDKNSLNERFLELSLDNQSKFPSSDNEAIKIEEQPSLHPINIPKPVRLNNMMQPTSPTESPPKNDNFLDNLIKMSQNDIQGISKYLNLDLDSKMQTWNKVTSNPTPTEKFKMSTIITNFMHSPFSLPFLRPDLLMPNTQNRLSDSQGSNSTHSDSDHFSQKYTYQGKYIGQLNQEQRQEKLTKYLDKKKNRRWKHIRYGIRKDLADQRERVQGRFIKTNKMFSHSDIQERYRDREGVDTMVPEEKMKNNSDLTFETMRLSSESLGKRQNKIDLFDDTSTSM